MERALLISMLTIWFWSTNPPPPFLFLPMKIPLANQSALRKVLIVTHDIKNSWNISVYEMEENIVPGMGKKTHSQRGHHGFVF